MKTLQVTDWSKQTYNVELVKNEYIAINCIYKNARFPKETTVTLRIGGDAVYGSYNLTYTGKIISITDKTVTIDTGMNERRRISLGDFCDRNWDFDAEKIAADNLLESYCI